MEWFFLIIFGFFLIFNNSIDTIDTIDSIDSIDTNIPIELPENNYKKRFIGKYNGHSIFMNGIFNYNGYQLMIDSDNPLKKNGFPIITFEEISGPSLKNLYFISPIKNGVFLGMEISRGNNSFPTNFSIFRNEKDNNPEINLK